MTVRQLLRNLFRKSSLRARRRQGRRPIESLEARALLAGNIRAEVSAESLFVFGDSLDNSVRLQVEGGRIVLRGIDGTTVNGRTDAFQVSPDATLPRFLTVKLGNGDDTLVIGGGLTVGDVAVIDLGAGDDRLSIGGATLQNVLLVRGRSGDDEIQLDGTRVFGQAFLRTGDGDDLLVLDSTNFSDSVRVSLGAGKDALRGVDVTIQGGLGVWLGAEDDTAELSDVSVSARYALRAGSGVDVIRATDLVVTGTALMKMQGGNDSVFVRGASRFSRLALFKGGAGQDALEIASSVQTLRGRASSRFESSDVSDSLLTARFDAANTGLTARAAALAEFFEDLRPSISIDNPAGSVQSNGVRLIRTPQFSLTGVTSANATVRLDSDNDGSFDDDTTTSDAQGRYSLSVALNAAAVADRTRTVRVQVEADGQTGEASLAVDVVVGTVVRFASNFGAYDVELLDTAAPATVQNFLNNLPEFADSIIHRSARSATGGDFIIQGGGFNGPPQVSDIIAPTINNEFSAANSNLRGTLSMALPPNQPNGGSSEWFINTADNAFLDAALHTVFGRVLGTGMTVVDTIHDLPTFNLVGAVGEGALQETPLSGYTPFTRNIAGTVTLTSGDRTVIGEGTAFTTQVRAGEAVRIGTTTFVVASVTSDTELELQTTPTTSASGAVMRGNALPAEANYVTFTTISTLSV